MKRMKISFLLSQPHIIYEILGFVPDQVANSFGEKKVNLY